MEEKTFLIELQNRPDGLTNQSINSYSTPAATLAMFYQRCAAAVTNTTFESVTLVVMDELGNRVEGQNIITQYQPPEPEPDPEPEPEPDPEPDPEPQPE